MTKDQMTTLFSPDLNLSPEARSIVAYVATLDEGEGEIPYTRLMRLVQVNDEKKLRRAIGEAEDAGWITVQRQTGKGHHPRFTFTPPKNGTLNDSPPKNGRLNAYSLPKNGSLKRTPPPTPTPPSTPSAREDDLDLARLRKMLAPHDRVIDQLADSTGVTTWAADLWGWYHPPNGPNDGGGTRWSEFRGLPTDEAMQVLASALGDYASEGAEYKRTYLRGFVRTAMNERMQQKSGTAARASPRGRGKRPPDEQRYEATEQFRGLKR